ncbi:histidine phosphatase family protein [Rubrobacter tropicus]|uniref:Histidine phosphatase family protein n=2 Tax=Rubrobacter tropicus TaxID=2653851 RepID=A0A6G8Q8L3_9ACTN|nr:histidine phosphatase family protein [Rubrobacter tropicus]
MPMPERQELLMVRHGQSTANAKGVWQGQMEFPLSEDGRLQAALAGKALAREPFEALYSSPLARAFETATIIARESGFREEIVPLDGLSERHGGVLEGHTWAEQERLDPAFAKKFLSLPEEDRWAFAGAETDEEVMERFEAAISEIRERHPEGTRIVVVSHGGAMRAFLRDRFGPDVLPGTHRAANASITRIGWGRNGTGPELLDLASTLHLPGEEGPDKTRTE